MDRAYANKTVPTTHGMIPIFQHRQNIPCSNQSQQTYWTRITFHWAKYCISHWPKLAKKLTLTSEVYQWTWTEISHMEHSTNYKTSKTTLPLTKRMQSGESTLYTHWSKFSRKIIWGGGSILPEITGSQYSSSWTPLKYSHQMPDFSLTMHQCTGALVVTLRTCYGAL